MLLHLDKILCTGCCRAAKTCLVFMCRKNSLAFRFFSISTSKNFLGRLWLWHNKQTCLYLSSLGTSGGTWFQTCSEAHAGGFGVFICCWQCVAAFAVSAVASQWERTGKPFNPLLGETYELVRWVGCKELLHKAPKLPLMLSLVLSQRGSGFQAHFRAGEPPSSGQRLPCWGP